LSQILKPYSAILDLKSGIIKSFKKRVQVKLSVLREFFNDGEAVDHILSSGEDPVVYEYFEHSQPEVEGQMNFGVTTVYPGKVGKEYHLTRGHYHAKEHAAELYMGLTGEGIMMMQTKDGEVAHLPIRPGDVVYVPPFWAHRTVNVGKEKLSFFYAYPSDAGHDYEVIRQKGFAKLVIEEKGQPKVVDNPKFIKT